jgi:ectoine hydroxylase-related dioxygenase (phytanoyl-CoA dioxygenase family)
MSAPLPPPARRELSASELASFHDDGFLVVRGLFSADEMTAVRTAIENDATLERNTMAMRDGAGKFARLALWHFIEPSTVYGAVAASRRMVHAARALTSTDVYHIHSKVILKEPRTGGAFDVHQDFGYWYEAGTLEPDVMLSCIVAVDEADVANGCLHVLARSHKLGRLDHGSSGTQAGADPDMVAAARARLPTVACELAVGDVLFTHSNLVHWSRANESDRWRRAVIVAYNGVRNPPYPRCTDLIPMPHALHEVDDDDVLRIGPVGFAAGAAEGASFLAEATNVAAYGKGPDVSAGAAAANQ